MVQISASYLVFWYFQACFKCFTFFFFKLNQQYLIMTFFLENHYILKHFNNYKLANWSTTLEIINLLLHLFDRTFKIS